MKILCFDFYLINSTRQTFISHSLFLFIISRAHFISTKPKNVSFYHFHILIFYSRQRGPAVNLYFCFVSRFTGTDIALINQWFIGYTFRHIAAAFKKNIYNCIERTYVHWLVNAMFHVRVMTLAIITWNFAWLLIHLVPLFCAD